MKQLTRLHEQFIEKSRRPLEFGALPVSPSRSMQPIIAVNRWLKDNDSLKKTFQFRLKDQRNDFIRQIIDHEEEIGHSCSMYIGEDEVTVILQTKDVGSVTELDKEFSIWCDEMFRDVVYIVQHDRRQEYTSYE